jgi:hypothetical protein
VALRSDVISDTPSARAALRRPLSMRAG